MSGQLRKVVQFMVVAASGKERADARQRLLLKSNRSETSVDIVDTLVVNRKPASLHGYPLPHLVAWKTPCATTGADQSLQAMCAMSPSQWKGRSFRGFIGLSAGANDDDPAVTGAAPRVNNQAHPQIVLLGTQLRCLRSRDCPFNPLELIPTETGRAPS